MEEVAMLYWALVFFIIGIVTAVFGFVGIIVATAEIARVLFFIFLLLFIISVVAYLWKHPGD